MLATIPINPCIPSPTYPEGGQKHLSAESRLYCRNPSTPRLADDWNEMSLHKIHAFGKVFDIEVSRMNSSLKVVIKDEATVLKEFEIESGETVRIEF